MISALALLVVFGGAWAFGFAVTGFVAVWTDWRFSEVVDLDWPDSLLCFDGVDELELFSLRVVGGCCIEVDDDSYRSRFYVLTGDVAVAEAIAVEGWNSL